jgi:hydrogenase maturation protease
LNENNVLVIGVGNDFRSDDGAGLFVARSLQARVLPGVLTREASGEGAALMDMWSGIPAVIMADAVDAGGEPGAIYRLDAGSEPIPALFFHYSTHAFSVAEAVEMARALGQLPPRFVIYGIEGQNYHAGQGLSPVVEQAARTVSARVLADIEAWQNARI